MTNPTTARLISDMLVSRYHQGQLNTDPQSIGQEIQLLHLMQDVLARIRIDMNDEGLSKSSCLLKECSGSLDRVVDTLKSAQAIEEAIRKIGKKGY